MKDGRPPVLGWVLLASSGAVTALVVTCLLLVIGLGGGAVPWLLGAVTLGGLVTMVLCAVAASRLQDVAFRVPPRSVDPPQRPRLVVVRSELEAGKRPALPPGK